MQTVSPFFSSTSISSVPFTAFRIQAKKRPSVSPNLVGLSQDIFQAQPRFGLKPTNTYLHDCIEDNNLEDSDIRLNKEFLESVGKQGMTPLGLAAHRHDYSAMRLLLKYEADPARIRETDMEFRHRKIANMTPLLFMASEGDYPAFVALQHHGANIQAKDGQGRGVYHWAAVSAIDISKRHLLHHLINRVPVDELDINEKDEHGRTAYDLVEEQATEHNVEDIERVLAVLRKKGGRPFRELQT